MSVSSLGWVGTSSNPTRTTDSHIKRITTSCCIHTVVPPDDVKTTPSTRKYSTTTQLKNIPPPRIAHKTHPDIHSFILYPTERTRPPMLRGTYSRSNKISPLRKPTKSQYSPFNISPMKYIGQAYNFLILYSKAMSRCLRSQHLSIYIGRSESEERLRIQPAQLFHCTRRVLWCVQ
jgi:hypothetical protein